MGRKRRRRCGKDQTELLNLLQRRASGAGDLERFRAMLACRFDLDRIGRFLWRIERRTLAPSDHAVRCGTYDEHPFSGWRAGTPEWSDPIPFFYVSTGEWSYEEPFYKLSVWISRTLSGAEIDHRGHGILNEMEQNPPTMNDMMTAVARHVDDLEAGRQAPLTGAAEDRMSPSSSSVERRRAGTSTRAGGCCRDCARRSSAAHGASGERKPPRAGAARDWRNTDEANPHDRSAGAPTGRGPRPGASRHRRPGGSAGGRRQRRTKRREQRSRKPRRPACRRFRNERSRAKARSRWPGRKTV